MANQLTAEDLLAGATTTFSVKVPAHLLRPREGAAGAAAAGSGGGRSAAGRGDGSGESPGERASDGSAAERVAGEIVLRPLTVRDLQRITRAGKEQDVLSSVLMVQQALVAPKLTVEQVGSLSAGLVQFLLKQVNALSGLEMGEDDLEQAVKAPLARACFVLSREFGWTPAQCSELTVGQVLLYLEMLARDGAAGGTA